MDCINRQAVVEELSNRKVPVKDEVERVGATMESLFSKGLALSLPCPSELLRGNYNSRLWLGTQAITTV